MLYKQKGTSYIGIFAIILVAALAAKMAVAIWPSYWDDRIINAQIKESLSSLSKGATPSQFKADMTRRLDMNNVRDVKIDDLMKVTNPSGLVVQKEYEVRKPFMFNIQLLMTFKKDFDQRSIATGE